MTRIFLISLIALTGCQKKEEATVYTVPKEKVNAAQPPAMFAQPAAPMMPGSSDMASRTLPADALNQDASLPKWNVPENWSQSSASAMRKATFSAPGTAGAADVSVTSFPGDVGGLLANINRWRGQISLPPLSANELENSIERLEVNGKEVIYSEMMTENNSTIAAVFVHEGASWFFKMTGPSETIAENRDAFKSYINSIRFN